MRKEKYQCQCKNCLPTIHLDCPREVASNDLLSANPEVEKINRTVDEFAKAMKRKMVVKYAEGYNGWDDSGCKEILVQKLLRHVHKGDGQEVDVANFAMMLWNLNR